MSPALRIGATGFGLIAVCYGFARFAFGLFLPQIDGDLTLGPSLSGIISGGAFAGYCIAIIASAVLTERIGARTVAVGAALVAAVGMAGIALAPSPLILAISVVVAGSSTGLASPPMAAAVAAAVQKSRQDTTNTVINAGTSAGVALSGPIALAIAGQWRLAFGAFAAHALKDLLSSGLLEAFRTGVHYQAIHAIALLVVGLLGDRSTTSKLLRWSGWAFATGILLFSGSLYILALTDIRWLGAITPFGGTAFLLGWALLAWFAMRRRP